MYAVKNEKGLICNKDVIFFIYFLAWICVHFLLSIMVIYLCKHDWLVILIYGKLLLSCYEHESKSPTSSTFQTMGIFCFL